MREHDPKITETLDKNYSKLEVCYRMLFTVELPEVKNFPLRAAFLILPDEAL